VDGECVVCERQGDVLVWVHGAGMSIEELLPLALAVTASR
jgi:hypothetical protein